jgi:hypothetical protein
MCKRYQHGFTERIWVGIALVLPPLACFAGCGGKGLERAVVSGNVTFDGKPLADAEIRFVPIEGTKAPISGAAVVNGRYEVLAKGGVPLGTHKVEIEAYRLLSGARPKQAANDDLFAASEPKEQYLPARYNKNSELRLAIPPGSDALTRDFELVP